MSLCFFRLQTTAEDVGGEKVGRGHAESKDLLFTGDATAWGKWETGRKRHRPGLCLDTENA